ncbi:MAG: VWA domain-containing protein [Phycisphaerales bacterium]|nr:VWA domain-containing protein [Phycisphaerales bacterium]
MIDWVPGTTWFFLLLTVIPLLWWHWMSRRQQSAIAFSSTSVVADAPRTWVQRTRWIVPVLRTIAIASLIVCLAGPMRADAITQVHSDGVAIELVVDRSHSMSAIDFKRNNQPINRLDAVKGVVADFVLGEEEDGRTGRTSDLIGLITFGTYADSNSPMTFDHQHLVESLKQVRIASLGPESGTAIGDAVGLAVSKLTSLKDREDLRLDDQIKSRIIILLTDGEQTSGELEPLESARLAEEYGIKIYTIGAGNESSPLVPMPNPRTGQMVLQRRDYSLDEDTLKEMAQVTGGRYFRATDLESLEDIYAAIDELERSEIHQQQYMQYEDMAVEPVRIAGFTLPPLLLIPMAALLLEILLASTLYRRLP